MELNKQPHNLLAIGIDERVFDEGSPMRSKVFEYSKDFDSSYIMCRSLKTRGDIEVVEKVTFYPIYCPPLLFPLAVWFYGRRIIRKNSGRWLISSDNPFELGLVSWVLARFFGAKLHLHLHTDLLSPPFRQGSFMDRLRYWCGRFVLARADSLRVVSGRIKKSLLGAGLVNSGVKISVLPIATDISGFGLAKRSPNIDKKLGGFSFKMIAVGRFVDKEKNFSMLLEIMPGFLETCPEAVLFLVGDGPDRKKYESTIGDHELEKNVIIEPWRKDLASFYKSFDVFVLSSNYEGWGRVVIEAMAAGLPIIMTDVGLAGEVVKNGINGIVVPVGDKTSFLKACVSMYYDKARREIFAKKGHETVRNMLAAFKEEEYALRYRKSLEI